MKRSGTIVPTEKTVVLVGAGNAHLVFLKRWGMRPIPGVAVTLVNEAAVVPYSAMVPAYLAGDYSWDEITIDLVRFCQSVKVRFVAERAIGIDPGSRRVHFADRPFLSFDALSLGLGSLASRPPNAPTSGSTLLLRPLSELLRRIDELEQQLRDTLRAFHLVVVGGGASGCELALAIHKRLSGRPGFHLTLLQGHDRLLPLFPRRVACAFETVFQQRQIDFRLNAAPSGAKRVFSCWNTANDWPVTQSSGPPRRPRRGFCAKVRWP